MGREKTIQELRAEALRQFDADQGLTSTSPRTTPMSATERKRLAALEATVDGGLAAFVEVGTALMEIRDARLYRETYGTFEAYCAARWGWTRQHANRTIQAAEVARALEPMGSIPNERQARELAPLAHDPAAARAVVEEASADGPPTAAKVRAAVQRRVRPAPEPEPEPLASEPVVCFPVSDVAAIRAAVSAGETEVALRLLDREPTP